MKTPRVSKIYVDMDGVLCDFEKRYKELYGNIKDRDKKSSFRPNFKEFIKTGQFATLEPMEDFYVLKSFLDSIEIPKEILSSTASEKRHDAIKPQKEYCLQTHNIGYKANFVPGKQNKYKFATPDSIIIDDTRSVIDDWNKAGGIGIWHRDWTSTLAILSQFI